MNFFVFPMIESLIRNLSGGIGRKLRFLYYRKRLGGYGKGVVIDEGVYFSSLKDIYIGDKHPASRFNFLRHNRQYQRSTY